MCVSEEEALVVTDDMTISEQKKVLVKLHKQFGHATADRLSQLLKNAGTCKSETLTLLQNVVDECEICFKYKKTTPRPVVGFPLASYYNETVAVDLCELENNVWLLHIIDEFSRFSAGCIVKTKQTSEFVEKFITYWIGVHGSPKKLYSDNGGEFNSAEVRDMAENFNIEVKTTAGYSAWSNGLLERHNATLKEIMVKVKADIGCDWNTALGWALNAKNSLHSVHGYSPYQVAFGQNPNLPSVLSNTPPALEGTTMSGVVGKHISALHATRKAFMESECSERIRRALRKQIRPSGEKYVTGNKVYYKRHDSSEWKGPGIVIGQDGVVVFVRHGGTYVRVHQCRLRHAKPILGDVSISEKTDSNNIGDSDTVNIDTLLQRDVDNQNSVDRDAVAESDSSDDDGVRDLGEQAQARAETDQQTVIVLKPGQSVQYLDRDSGDIVVGRILGRAGKATGRNKNWYNLEFVQPELKAGEKGSVDLSRVDDLETTIDSEDVAREQDESVMKLEGVSFDDAKCGELNSWKKNQVYIEIPDMGQKCISTRWICTLKETDIGIVPKARLVARGFEELYTSDIQRDSPTCTKESLKMILAVIAQNGWKPCSMDIKTAFLQGHELERDIFIRPPKEADSPGIIWRLKKCVYGLVDASLYWYNRVKSVMLDLGANISRVDPAVFYWIDSDNQVIGILASHVDDFIWSGTPYFEESVINKVRSTFCVGKENSVAFQYIGMDLSCEKDEILLHQDQYVENIAPINIEKNRALQRESYLDDSEKHSLRSKIGQLLWVAHQSRPDIVFDACCLANRVKNAQVQDILDTNKVVRRLKSETVSLKFQHVGVQEKLKLVVFSDASLGNLPDGGTQGGHFIVLMGPDGLFSPICWQSKRIRRVVRSTLAGETLALADGVDNCIFLSTLYMELTKGVSQPSEVLPITCVVDNHSLYDAIKSTKFVADKRLRLEISNIKELLKTKQVREVCWTNTKEQLADCLTKKGASPFGLLKALSQGVWHVDCGQ